MTYKEEEYAKQYFLTKDPTWKDKALREMDNLIYKTIEPMNVSGSFDMRVLINKARGIAAQAIETWDPNKSKLNTHVVNQLKQLTRTVYQTGPIFQIPEHRIGEYSKFQKALQEYETEYGSSIYDPVILSDLSGIPIKRIKVLLKENRKAYNDSTINTTDIDWEDKTYKYDLNFFDYSFKQNRLMARVWNEVKKCLKENKKPHASEIARQLGENYIEINKIFKKIIEVINETLSGR